MASTDFLAATDAPSATSTFAPVTESATAPAATATVKPAPTTPPVPKSAPSKNISVLTDFEDLQILRFIKTFAFEILTKTKLEICIFGFQK
jgi:hypothetical protein